MGTRKEYIFCSFVVNIWKFLMILSFLLCFVKEVQLDTEMFSRGWMPWLIHDPTWSCFSTFLGKVLSYVMTTATLCHVTGA